MEVRGRRTGSGNSASGQTLGRKGRAGKAWPLARLWRMDGHRAEQTGLGTELHNLVARRPMGLGASRQPLDTT